MSAATAPDIGHGSKAEISVDEGTTFIPFTRLVELQFPNPTFDDVDATHFESAGRMREYIAGLGDNGEVALVIQHLPGSAIDVALRAALGSSVQLRLTENGGNPETYAAVVKAYERNIPMDDIMTASVTLRMGPEIVAAP